VYPITVYFSTFLDLVQWFMATPRNSLLQYSKPVEKKNLCTEDRVDLLATGRLMTQITLLHTDTVTFFSSWMFLWTYLFDYNSLVYIVYSPFRFEKRILWFKCRGCQTHCLRYCLFLCPCHLPFNRCFPKIWITVFKEILCCGKQRNGQID